MSKIASLVECPNNCGCTLTSFDELEHHLEKFCQNNLHGKISPTGISSSEAIWIPGASIGAQRTSSSSNPTSPASPTSPINLTSQVNSSSPKRFSNPASPSNASPPGRVRTDSESNRQGSEKRRFSRRLSEGLTSMLGIAPTALMTALANSGTMMANAYDQNSINLANQYEDNHKNSHRKKSKNSEEVAIPMEQFEDPNHPTRFRSLSTI